MTFPAPSQTSPSSASPSNELFWQAYQYVQNELSADEMAAFEERLATDQLAREVVAAAVELNDASFAALALASKEEKVRCRSAVAQAAFTAIAVAALALLALIVGPRLLTSESATRHARSPMGEKGRLNDAGEEAVVAADPQLAMLWAQQLDELDSTDGELMEWEDGSSPVQEVVAWEQGEPEQPANWMWLALSAAENEANAKPTPGTEIGNSPLDMPVEESL